MLPDCLSPTVIQDDFLGSPDSVREWALSRRFYSVDQYNARFEVTEVWPGRRTRTLGAAYPEFVQRFVSHLLHHVLGVSDCEYQAELSFQLTQAADGGSWIHKDDRRFTLAGLVFLSPTPPSRSGTVFYRRTQTGSFETTEVVANRYNRLLIFGTQVYHKSDQYFGRDRFSARLTLPFFLSLRPRPS